MNINYLAVIVCAVLSMVTGYVWFGPLFGKKWLETIKAKPEDLEARKEMQKKAGPLYGVQFILSLFQIWILANLISGVTDGTGLISSLWIWAGFVMPTVAGASMWNNDSAKVSWTRFWLQAGYQLLNFVIFGLVLSLWR